MCIQTENCYFTVVSNQQKRCNLGKSHCLFQRPKLILKKNNKSLILEFEVIVHGYFAEILILYIFFCIFSPQCIFSMFKIYEFLMKYSYPHRP